VFELKDKLNEFRLAKYRFMLQPKDLIRTPKYTGNYLRKDFPSIFHQIACLEPDDDCKKCKQKDNCPFFISLDDRNVIKDPEYKRYKTPPKPFIFEPPLKRKLFYSPQNPLYFDLTLFGKALEYLPFFVASIRQLGEIGIGQNYGKYDLKKIQVFNLLENRTTNEININGEAKYDENDGSISFLELFDKFEEENNSAEEVAVSIVTPFRMKRLRTEGWHFYFRSLVKNILTRLANLALAYSDYEEFLYFPDVLFEAGKIRTIKENLIWEDWRHPSIMQKHPDSHNGGYYGEVTYQGNAANFMPILRLGELIHIGKNTSYGLGRILVERKTNHT